MSNNQEDMPALGSWGGVGWGKNVQSKSIQKIRTPFRVLGLGGVGRQWLSFLRKF